MAPSSPNPARMLMWTSTTTKKKAPTQKKFNAPDAVDDTTADKKKPKLTQPQAKSALKNLCLVQTICFNADDNSCGKKIAGFFDKDNCHEGFSVIIDER